MEGLLSTETVSSPRQYSELGLRSLISNHLKNHGVSFFFFFLYFKKNTKIYISKKLQPIVNIFLFVLGTFFFVSF